MPRHHATHGEPPDERPDERPDGPGEEPPSKSELKRRSLELQQLGVALVELPAAELDALGLPESLHDAIVAARGIRSRGALVRQRQYIGKLMRHVDDAAIRAALDARRQRDRQRIARERRIEQWRDRLLAGGDAALAAFLAEHPAAEPQQLRELVERALAERTAERPPAAARQLFQRVRSVLDAAGD